MTAQIVKSIFSWIVSLDIIKSTFSQRINLRLHVSIPGVHFPIGNSHFVWRMLGPCFNGKWITLWMILNTSCNLIWMISLLFLSIRLTIQCILGSFSYSVDTTIFDWIHYNVSSTLFFIDFLVLFFQNMEFVSILWKYRQSSTCLHLLHSFNFSDFKGKITSCEGSSLIMLSWPKD